MKEYKSLRDFYKDMTEDQIDSLSTNITNSYMSFMASQNQVLQDSGIYADRYVECYLNTRAKLIKKKQDIKKETELSKMTIEELQVRKQELATKFNDFNFENAKELENVKEELNQINKILSERQLQEQPSKRGR